MTRSSTTLGLLLSTISMVVTISSTHALSQSIVVVGLNAALQKRFILPPGKNLEPGNVHRAQIVETGVGGKGQDVGVALSCLMLARQQSSTTTTATAAATTTKSCEEENNKVMLAQFLGMGPEGDAVSGMLQFKYGLSDALTIRNAAPLRTCTTIVGADQATELVETSGEVTRHEMKAMQTKLELLTNRGGRANCVCIMGSMPPGCDEDTYADLTSRLADSHSLVLIDSVIGLEPLLSALNTIFSNTEGKKHGGAVLKLNAAEICKLAGVAKGAGETDQVTLEELTASTIGLVTRYADAVALDYLCITDGKVRRHASSPLPLLFASHSYTCFDPGPHSQFPGYLVEVPQSVSTSFRTWQLPSVDLSNAGMLYPIGAGDTVAAGTLAAWQYLHHDSGVLSSHIGKLLCERKTKWSSGEDDTSLEVTRGYNMATAFAFGLACGSASCLKPENSVFDVDEALSFFESMTKPVIR